MGLDTVELILRIEEEFSISIDDYEAEQVRKVDDLYQLVLNKVSAQPSCLSSKAFYRVRRALVECSGVPRQQIRPSTHLDSIMPRDTLVAQWQNVADLLGLALPPLRRRLTWADRFLGPFASSPYAIQTAGDLANSVLTMNYSELASESQLAPKLSTDDVWVKLVAIFCDQLGVEVIEVVPNARIGEDLGVD